MAEGSVQNFLHRDRILIEARSWVGTAYLYGGNTTSGIDCSHFVWQVMQTIFPGTPYVETTGLANSSAYEKVDVPMPGDVVEWSGHMAIVTNEAQGTFIGAQTSTGVAETSYKTNSYWINRPNRQFFRLRALSKV